MRKIHKEILTKEQNKLLPLIKNFSKNFGLVGGTAIALQIGHRESIDFNLFTDKKFNSANIRRKIFETEKIDETIVSKEWEFTVLINRVKFTFYNYPFSISYPKKFDNIIKMPDLLTLATMKLYALGRRAKWKDYVDLYFIIKDFHSLDEIIKKGRKIFKQEFNVKICKAQLSYFDDVDYSEKIVYAKGFKVSDEKIKKSLIEFILN